MRDYETIFKLGTRGSVACLVPLLFRPQY